MSLDWTTTIHNTIIKSLLEKINFVKVLGGSSDRIVPSRGEIGINAIHQILHGSS